jgi:hypothetical protein
MKRWFVSLGCLVAVPAFLVLAGRSPSGPGPGRPHDADPGRFGISLAASTVSGLRAREVPHLIIRCLEHKTEVYVVTGVSTQPEPKVGKHTVRLRFDDDQQEREIWDQSADDRALFSQHPIRFVNKVARAKTLTFEFTPFQAGAAVATFSVAGFDKRLPALRRCVERS